MEVPDSVKKCTRPGTKIKEARRFYPFSGKGEGQFVCVLQKKSETDEWTRTKKPSVNFLGRKDKEIVNVFLKENFDIPFDYELIVLHESVMLVRSSIIDVCSSGLNIINAGVRVGSIEKGVLRPHHQLFTALGDYSKHKHEMNDEDAKNMYMVKNCLLNMEQMVITQCLCVVQALVAPSVQMVNLKIFIQRDSGSKIR